MASKQSRTTIQPELINACRRLSDGACVAIPTETVYGLAADATNGEAIARIFELKGRPKFNPLICHVDGLDMAEQHGIFDVVSKTLANAFWPGPLTLVVPLSPSSDIHPLVTTGLGTVGLRHPQGIAAELISDFGKPLAAPSANQSGRLSTTTADHVRRQFRDEELLVLDNGPCSVGLESTIIKCDDLQVVILRPGAITANMIEATTGITPVTAKNGKIEAPGMLQSHYAPTAQIVLHCTSATKGSAWLQFGNQQPADVPSRNLSKTGNLVEAATNLYHHLQVLDATGVETICVSSIPMTGLGIAINDRLNRAAAPRGEQ